VIEVEILPFGPRLRAMPSARSGRSPPHQPSHRAKTCTGRAGSASGGRPLSSAGGAENLGEGLLGGLRVRLEDGDQVSEPDAVGQLRSLDHLGHSGGQVRARVVTQVGGEGTLGAGEVVGHAGELADEGGGQAVSPLPGPVPTRLPQVDGEVVVADRDVTRAGGGVAVPDRGPGQVRRPPARPDTASRLARVPSTTARLGVSW
jgi:hypothetical protein